MERKIVVSINECKIGTKIAENIFNSYGAVIIAENSILDDKKIEKLKDCGITRLKVYKDDGEDIKDPIVNRMVKQYETHVETVKDVIKDISEGKNLELEKVEVVAENLLDKFNENKNVLNCIKKIRSADEYTYNHCVNVSLLSMMIGKWLKMKEEDIRGLVLAGLLHDIGKAKVDKYILNKPGKLSPEEFEEMKKHVVYAKEILDWMPDINKDIIMGVVMHHEREDGSGYMLGAKNTQIHPYAKIIAVADVYDAMTANRVYREKQNPFDVFEHIRASSYSSLDTNICLTFLNYITSYYIGDACRLNTDEIGEIISINQRDISRPLIRIDGTYIDLSEETNMKIVEIL